MSRIVMDSISFAALSGKHWPHLMGYVNGRVSAWSSADIATARRKDQLLGLVDVLGTAPKLASVLDFERGDVQSTAVVGRWTELRNEFAHDAVVYVQPPNIHKIVSAVGRTPVGLWVVDLTPDGELAFDVPDYGPLPPNVRIVGRQCVFGPRSGGNFDLSVFYDDNWHPEQQHPAHYSLIRAQSAAELGPYSAAVLPDVDKLTAAAAAGTAAGEAAAAVASARWPSPGSPLEQTADVINQAATDVAGASLVLSTAPDSPTPGVPTAADVIGQHLDRIAREAGPASAGSGTAAADVPPGPAQSQLNHDFIRTTLQDVKSVANMFRTAGHPNVAAELERALGVAWELGSMIKAAGL